jgi:Ser/Thr protein kinase RdoA (MazF antagonist)
MALEAARGSGQEDQGNIRRLTEGRFEMLRIDEVDWVELSDRLRSFMQRDAVNEPLTGGYEAETLAVIRDTDKVVLKVWNKDSRPDVAYQFRLHASLRNIGIRVPAPLGWGNTRDGHQVLAASHEGQPIQNVAWPVVAELAELLRSVHRIAHESLDLQLPQYDFISYFFPRIEEHHDLHEAVKRLTDLAGMRQDCLIHGDYNMGNVLANAEGYALIDWTNAQLGDARYDAAWASYLLRIYNGDEVGARFMEAYLAIGDEKVAQAGSWSLFESIACLRWLLLDRVSGLSPTEDMVARINAFIRESSYLDDGLLLRSIT